jgi:hypothetical protein
MDNDIVLHGDRLALDTDAGRRFVSDLAQFADGTLSETMIRKRWRLDDATWERLGQDDELVEAIENEKLARIRSGETKRQRAQQLVIQAPNVMNQLMLDDRASPRHRIDAAKALDSFAAHGSEASSRNHQIHHKNRLECWRRRRRGLRQTADNQIKRRRKDER